MMHTLPTKAINCCNQSHDLFIFSTTIFPPGSGLPKHKPIIIKNQCQDTLTIDITCYTVKSVSSPTISCNNNKLKVISNSFSTHYQYTGAPKVLSTSRRDTFFCSRREIKVTALSDQSASGLFDLPPNKFKNKRTPSFYVKTLALQEDLEQVIEQLQEEEEKEEKKGKKTWKNYLRLVIVL